MLKELKTIEIISNYLRQCGVLKEIESIIDIYNFFEYLQENKHTFNTLYIYSYLYHFISSNEVAKRKTSARVFEDLLAILFNAQVADTQHRKNLSYEVSDYFINVKDKIASNRREKADVIFANGYSFSVKTLIATNKEINMGSFEKKVLFDSLKVDNYLSERTSSDGAGVGSKPQFLKLLTLIETLSSYESFREKFNKMAEFIYADDLLLAIKDDTKMQLYFLSGKELVRLFYNLSENKNKFLSIVNRYEGNSLRIDRDILLQQCSMSLSLDFSYLSSSVMELVSEFDYLLHESYVKYFNGDRDSRNKALHGLESLFSSFEAQYKGI